MNAGDTLTPRLHVPAGDAATAVDLTVLDPHDQWSAVPVHPESGFTVWDGDPLVVAGGEYRLYWHVTGPGAEASRTELITVGPAEHPGVPGGFSFATVADLVEYSGQPMPDRARRLLVDASAEIERLTKTAVYATGVDGRPADPRLRTALADATCELVLWWAETGTETGARALFQSASIAGVSLGFGGQASANPQADRVGPKVWTMLLNSGLIHPGGVRSYG